MKTQSTIKHTASLFSAAVLLALPGHAAQNFSKTHNFTTGDSKYGVSGSFTASDNFTPPTAAKPGTYALTTGGNVTARIAGRQIPAVSGTGTAKVLSDGTATFTGHLKILGGSVMSASAKSLPITFPHIIMKWNNVTTVPVVIGGVSFKIRTGVLASVDGHFRVSSSFTPVRAGIPEVAFTIGPAADVAVVVLADGPSGVPEFDALETGGGGTLGVGKAALHATAIATQAIGARQVLNAPSITRHKATVEVSLATETAGPNGRLDLWAEAQVRLARTRTTWNIANYSSGTTITNLLGPVTYGWY